MRRRHELTDEQWATMEPHLPGRKGDPGHSGENNRRFVNAVLWIAKTGDPWHDLPERFGHWNTVFQRFRRWCKKGVWTRLAEQLEGEQELIHVFLDSSIGPSSICGNDSRIIRNHHSKLCDGQKIVLGHEFAGVIVQPGSRAGGCRLPYEG